MIEPTISDGLIVAATLLGPILAVQAQKYLERRTAAHGRKKVLFEMLMATRGSRLAQEHVRGLNMIEVTFYGESEKRRKIGERDVLAAWREYLDFLSERNEMTPEVASARRDELFVNLLEKMATDLGYQFDRVQLRRGAYSPVAHGLHESKNEDLRDAALAVFSGDRELKVAFSDRSPADPAAAPDGGG
ncbi:DUF6680 family protein [Stenotrophomonas sp.]|uniref:DUF6680 family protein n=1 Tax=Stenotrophomonas sp. TaxID=69392 RepID=UPI002FCCB821